MRVAEKFLAWLWDPKGTKRAAQVRRISSMRRKIRRGESARARAAKEIVRTQDIVREVLPS